MGLAILSTQEVNNNFDGSAADSVVTVSSFILISFVWKRRNHERGQALEIPVHDGGDAHAVPLQVPLQERLGLQGVGPRNGRHISPHVLYHLQNGGSHWDQVPAASRKEGPLEDNAHLWQLSRDVVVI